MKRIRSLLFLALALGIGLYSLPSAALQFNYSTRLTLTDCDDADEAGFNTGTTILCYDLTAGRDEIWNGSAWVAYQGGGSSGGTQYTEGDTDASITGTALLWEDSGNALTPVNTSKPLPVTSAVTSVIPGTAATNLGKAEDAAHNSGDTGVAILVRRCDTASVGSDTDGDYSVPCVDSSGRLWTSSVNYVSENNTTGTSTDVAATALGVGGAGVELINGYDLGAIAATYCTLAITNSADGAIDAAKIYLLPSGETNLTAPNVLGGSTGTTSAHFTAPAVGSPLEWATSWVTSTGVIGDGDLTDLAASSVWVGRLKVAGADKLYVEISGDGAVDTTYRLSCN